MGDYTVYPLATNIASPFSFNCVPKYSGLIPSVIYPFLWIFTTSLKILLNLSYCYLPSKRLQLPPKNVGFDMMYCARANTGQTTGLRRLE